MTWIAPILLWAPTLFDQSVAHVLEQNFSEAQFILIDLKSNELLGSRWAGAELPVPVGSLVKPFTALAATGPRKVLRCNPAECWLRSGHGDIGLVQAMAQSCNSYFLQLAGSVRADRLGTITQQYGLPMPKSLSKETLAGMGHDWRISPMQMAIAFGALATAPGAEAIREGMRDSARDGTAKAIRVSALAKTGTAPCTHPKRAPGDGFVAVLYPAQTPKYVLLVQVHGVSGAVAASTAARMVAVLRDGK